MDVLKRLIEVLVKIDGCSGNDEWRFWLKIDGDSGYDELRFWLRLIEVLIKI